MLTLLQEPYLLEKYEIVERIGEGQYSFVYRGKIRATGQDVVLKFWPALEISQAKDREWLQEDLKTYIHLRHPYILPVLEAKVLERAVYVVSAYAAHGSLQDRLTGAGSQLLPLGTAQKIISQVGQALHSIHRHGLSHGDVVPGNILFDERDDAFLSDFYYARFQSLTQGHTGENASMRWYLAPELISGVFSPASDQYTLACIAYMLFCGQVPFAGNARTTLMQKHKNVIPTDLLQHNSLLPLFVNDAVLKALSKDPADRFPDVEAFLRALQVPVEPYPVVSSEGDSDRPLPTTVGEDKDVADQDKSYDDSSLPDLPEIMGLLSLDQLKEDAAEPAQQITASHSLADATIPDEQRTEADLSKGDQADSSQPFLLPLDEQPLLPLPASQPMDALQENSSPLLTPSSAIFVPPVSPLSQPLNTRPFQTSTEGRLFPGRFSSVRAQKDRSMHALVPIVAVALVIFLTATVVVSIFTFSLAGTQHKSSAAVSPATPQNSGVGTRSVGGFTVLTVTPTSKHASAATPVPTVAPTATPVPVLVPTPATIPTTSPTVAPTKSAPKPTPTPTVQDTVIPVLNCVQRGSRGMFLAKFGYISKFSQVVLIPVGNSNNVTPSAYNGSQTTIFSPGENDEVLQIHGTSTASWTLDGVTVVANYFSGPSC